MPIYEYGCKSCGEKFEKLVRTMQGTEDVACPKCGAKQVERALSVFAAVGSEGKDAALPPGMCGRCGGPGPCARG